MKERLVEQIGTFCKEELGANFNKDIIEKFANSILADGWMRPPCKVGDEVYLVTPNGKIREINITDIYIEIKPTATVMRLSATFYVDNKPYFFQVSPFDFGKTIFLTREEAEAKLKEGGE